MALAPILRRWFEHDAEPTDTDIKLAFDTFLNHEADPVVQAAFLTYLRCRGETVTFLTCAAEILREHMIPLHAALPLVLDTCGTGGDGKGYFNVSTAAALLIAATGTPVAKHGNRSFSSASGSADVLNALHIPIDLPPERASECLRSSGFVFCFAPHYHPAMKRVADVRKQLGFRTLFNLIGPLTNPAKPSHQLIGCPHPRLAALLAQTICQLGTQRTIIVSGSDGSDEVSLEGMTHVWTIERNQLHQSAWHASDFGLPSEPLEACRITDAASSAKVIEQIFHDPTAPGAQLVLINASAGLLAAGRVESLLEGLTLAKNALASGAALQLLHNLRKFH